MLCPFIFVFLYRYDGNRSSCIELNCRNWWMCSILDRWFFLWIIELNMRVTTFHFVDVISLLRYFEIFQFSLSLLALWPSVSRCGGNALYQTRVNAGNASINYHDDHHCMQQATSKRKGLDALNRVPITFISFDCSALFSLQAFCSQSFDHISSFEFMDAIDHRRPSKYHTDI